MSERMDVNAVVKAITLGLDGQPMTDMVRGELARRLAAYLAGDPKAGVRGFKPPPAPRWPISPDRRIAQAIAVATCGRVRPPGRDIRSEDGIREGRDFHEWLYSGYGFEDWSAVLDEIGRDAIAAHVEHLMRDVGWKSCRAEFGVGRRKDRTLTIS